MNICLQITIPGSLSLCRKKFPMANYLLSTMLPWGDRDKMPKSKGKKTLRENPASSALVLIQSSVLRILKPTGRRREEGGQRAPWWYGTFTVSFLDFKAVATGDKEEDGELRALSWETSRQDKQIFLWIRKQEGIMVLGTKYNQPTSANSKAEGKAFKYQCISGE